MTQKPHRQIRHSNRVSSETGVAITAEPAPPRRAMIAEIVREELEQ